MNESFALSSRKLSRFDEQIWREYEKIDEIGETGEVGEIGEAGEIW